MSTDLFVTDKPAMPKGPRQGLLDTPEEVLSAPKLKIVQGMDTTLIEQGCKIGDVYSESHNCVLPQPVTMAFIHTGISWTYFDQDEGFQWSTMDKNDSRVVALGDDAWKIKYFRAVVLAPLGMPKYPPQVQAFSCRGTAWGAVRQLYKKIDQSGLDAYGMSFQMSTTTQPGKMKGSKIAVPEWGNPLWNNPAFVKELGTLFSQTQGQLQDLCDRQQIEAGSE